MITLTNQQARRFLLLKHGLLGEHRFIRKQGALEFVRQAGCIQFDPADKRKYGFYVLPILYGDRLIGRVEAAADKKQNTLIVKNIWNEDGVRITKKLPTAVDRCLGRLAKLNGCGGIRQYNVEM